MNVTGVELIELQGRLYGLNRTEVRRRVAELTDVIGIGDALGRRIATYSVGMRRRVDLAAAIVHNPSILFLDEPTTGLDPASRQRVWEEIVELNTQRGMTILLTTQYLDEADELAGRVGIIDRGQLVAEGPPELLKRSFGGDVIEATVQVDHTSVQTLVRLSGVEAIDTSPDGLVFFVEDGVKAIGPIAVAMAEMGTPAAKISLRRPTLEEVFLKLTDSESTDDHGNGRHGR